MEIQLAKEEGGVLVTRHSWINRNENIQLLFEGAADTLNWQLLATTTTHPVLRHHLCDVQAKALRFPLTNLILFPPLGSYVHWSMNKFVEEVAHSSPVYTMLEEQFTAVADNPWLGPLYGPQIPPSVYEINERLTVLLKRHQSSHYSS